MSEAGLPWPDLRSIGMSVVPATGVQPGNVLVLSDRLGLPELAAALGFRPYKGLHVLRRGVSDPGFAAAAATVGAAVSYLLPDVPFRLVDPVPLTWRGPGGAEVAAAAVDAALRDAPEAPAPDPARADAEATRAFEELPLARPGQMLAEACAFAAPTRSRWPRSARTTPGRSRSCSRRDTPWSGATARTART